MEEQKKLEEKKPNFYKKKVVGIPIFALMIIGIAVVLVAAGVVYYYSFHVNVTVSEALNSQIGDISINAYPGETIFKNFTITNSANVPLKTQLTWVENSNQDNVSYTTNMPDVVTLQPGLNIALISFTITEDSKIGLFNGTINLSRIPN